MGKIFRSQRDGTIYEKKDPTNTCNGWAKDHYCKRPTGWRTGHPGSGRCIFHGGCSLGRPKEKFSPTSFCSTDILRKLEEVNKHDPNAIINLAHEINVVRANFYGYVIDCYRRKELVNPAKLSSYISTLVKLVNTMVKLEKKSKEVSNHSLFVLYAEQVSEILRRHLSPEQLQRVARDMRRIK